MGLVAQIRGDIINIFIDFDGTMVDTISAICSLYNEDYSYYDGYIPAYPTMIDTWDLNELTLLDKDELNRYFNQPRLFNRLDGMPYVFTAIKELHNLGHKLTVVTIGDRPNIRLKAEYLSNMFYDKIDDFIGIESNVMDKSSVDMSGGILIDDHIKNLESSNADIKICFGGEYEYNRDWNGIRCYNWTDVLTYFWENGIV